MSFNTIKQPAPGTGAERWDESDETTSTSDVRNIFIHPDEPANFAFMMDIKPIFLLFFLKAPDDPESIFC